jgi:hypothetical protein
MALVIGIRYTTDGHFLACHWYFIAATVISLSVISILYQWQSYTRPSLVFCTSDGHLPAHHWYFVPVTVICPPVTSNGYQ